MLNKITKVLLTLSLFILNSCIEGEEEIWINQDASGRLVAHYSIPPLALSKLGKPEDYINAIKTIDEREDGIEVQVITFEIVNFKAVFHLEATFENAMDLLEIAERSESVFVEEANADPHQLDSLSGDIELGMEALSPTFSRSVSLASLLPAELQNSPQMLGKSNFKYTIHLPVAVEETNAHEISEDKKTVSWTFLLKNFATDPMVMSVKTKLPIPWWIIAILAAVVAFTIWLLWKRRTRRLHRAGRID